MMHLFFAYINARGAISANALTHYKEDNVYLRGYSEQHARVLTFKKERIIQQFHSFKDAQSFINDIPLDILTPFQSLIDKEKKRIISNPNPDNGELTFCFTGFKKSEKQQMMKLVKELNLRTVENVSSRVNYLVACESSNTIGPKKLQLAASFKIKVIYEDAFYELLETGLIPE